MAGKGSFTPSWFEGIAPERSYRAAFKWGAPGAFKHPNSRLYALIKERFDLDDEDFRSPLALGLERVHADAPSALSSVHAAFFRRLLGDDNVSDDVYERLRASYGKTTIEALRLRHRRVENLPDLVLDPRDRHDVEAIVRYCSEQRIPLYPRGAGSGVTRGTECVEGGVSVRLTTHMNRVLALSPVNQTVTVEPGILGPALETALNDAPQRFGAPHPYTCGHFPQSFEFSSAGGWVMTRGAGQSSTYYGKAEDLVLSQEYVTPAGAIRTVDVPAYATGPNLDQVMIGSEGAYGVLVALTLKVFRHRPEDKTRFSFVFPEWPAALNAAREIMQGEFGFPSVFRLSDPEETEVAFKLYGIEGTPVEALAKLRGLKRGKRCLLLGTVDGDRAYTSMVKRRVREVCKDHGGFYTTGLVTRRWEHGRFTDPYLREDLQDYGLLIDTLECATSWDELLSVHAHVRAFIKSRPRTICMAHTSHCYPQGANLYFIFMARMGLAEFVDFHRGVLDAIQSSGATMSHHHGIGKMTAPWLEGQVGKNELEVFRALKRHFDPHNVLNPGGTLALDMPDEERRLP